MMPVLTDRLANLVTVFLHLKQFPGEYPASLRQWQKIHRLAVILEKSTRT